ncbi:hypothetical protein BGZ65_006302 [Modicella reniformis]|uniref:Major facilitator superfamily (MFS) profile domain-containing protein n=1 Tax=Modicella reniformis TaxID=1440133 RepID=A0A9P6LRE1_9FUNG|nr:hypothetical protein BGZ65_006302 [Modicella reniformis]
MLIGLVGMMISIVLYILATNFYVFLLARLLQGVAGGSIWTLGLTLITDVFPANTLSLQMGKALVGYTLGLMMGPPLGGVLYEHVGYQAPFFFCFIIILVDFVCRALIVEEREETMRAAVASTAVLGEQEGLPYEVEAMAMRRKEEKEKESTSFWKLIKNKRLVGSIIVTACYGFVFSGVEPTVPLHLAETFDLTPECIGLVFMAFSLPTLTAPLFGTAFLTPVLSELSAVVRTTTDTGIARAYAIFNMAFSIGVLIGPVVCGMVYEHFGFVYLSFTMAGVLFMGGVPTVILCLGRGTELAQSTREDEERAMDEDTYNIAKRSKY